VEEATFDILHKMHDENHIDSSSIIAIPFLYPPLTKIWDSQILENKQIL